MKQILLVCTLANVWRSVWRILILMLGCKGLNYYSVFFLKLIPTHGRPAWMKLQTVITTGTWRQMKFSGIPLSSFCQQLLKCRLQVMIKYTSLNTKVKRKEHNIVKMMKKTVKKKVSLSEKLCVYLTIYFFLHVHFFKSVFASI